MVPPWPDYTTHAEIGITRKQAQEWRKMVEAGGDAAVEEAISDAAAEGQSLHQSDLKRTINVPSVQNLAQGVAPRTHPRVL